MNPKCMSANAIHATMHTNLNTRHSMKKSMEANWSISNRRRFYEPSKTIVSNTRNFILLSSSFWMDKLGNISCTPHLHVISIAHSIRNRRVQSLRAYIT
jgi:hypothetical protein